jgi:D-glycero-D-manno-heptose 1,7-bisphosphate phosphatase
MQPSTTRPLSRYLILSQSDLDNRLSRQEKCQPSRAIFLDRDGTINVERGYLLDPDDIELNPTAGEAIYTLNNLGILIIIITNQASIDKKLLSLERFEEINEKLWEELSNADAYYDALYFCPHSPEITPGCPCRKPKPGLILQAAKDFNIDLTSSFMIGDKLSDIEAGQLSGCKTILVLTGRGENAYKELMNNSDISPNFIAQTLGEAAEWIRYNIQK